MLNTDLFNLIADHIEADPDRYDQRVWLCQENAAGYAELQPGDLTMCATAGCVAGWAVALTAQRVPDHTAPAGIGAAHYIESAAQDRLGLTDLQAEILFHPSWRPAGDLDVVEALRLLADGAGLGDVTDQLSLDIRMLVARLDDEADPMWHLEQRRRHLETAQHHHRVMVEAHSINGDAVGAAEVEVARDLVERCRRKVLEAERAVAPGLPSTSSVTTPTVSTTFGLMWLLVAVAVVAAGCAGPATSEVVATAPPTVVEVVEVVEPAVAVPIPLDGVDVALDAGQAAAQAPPVGVELAEAASIAQVGGDAARPQQAAVVAEPAPTIVVTPDDVVPAGVDPVEQAATIDADGTIHHADGTTGCVVASPCDYAAAGYSPDDLVKPGDVDPVWDVYAAEVEAGHE